MSAVTFPVGLLVDDAGAVLAAPVVTIVSVVDKAGTPIASHGATVNGSASATPISVDYDVALKGEAWVTLSVSQSAHTVTGARALVAIFASSSGADLAQLLGALTDADITLAADTLSGTMSVYASGTPHISGNLLYTVALSRASTGQPFSFDRV